MAVVSAYFIELTGEDFSDAVVAAERTVPCDMALIQTAVANRLDGTVTVGGQPVAGASVTLWRTAGKEAPKSVAEVSTGAQGEFTLHDFPLLADGGVFYLTTRGGLRDALALMSVLGTEPPDKVVVNELTTVALVFTIARFINRPE